MTQTTEAIPTQVPDAYVSWREFLTGGHTASLFLVSLAVMLHAADSLIVATMLPSIVADINGASLVGLSVSLYEMGSIVAGAASAILTMRMGLRHPMALAAGMFGLGCLLSAVSPTMALFLVGRTMQGLGGGGMVAMCFIAISVLFPRRYAARALAVVSTIWGISSFLGPLFGGAFVAYATWRWGFACFGAVAFGLGAWIFVRPQNEPAPQQTTDSVFPFRRLMLLCLAILLIAASGVSIAPLRSGMMILCGIAALVLFLWLDARAGDSRMLPRRPFDLRTPIGAALVMIVTLSMATIAIAAFGPLLITAIHHAPALTVGYVVSCGSIGWTLAAILVSGFSERTDRLMIALGMGLVAASVPGMLYAVPYGPLWLIALVALIEGIGFGMAWTFVLRRTETLASASEVQRIAGAIPTVQRLGYALGAVYVGLVANAAGILTMTTGSSAIQVAQWVYVSCLPLAALGMVATLAFVRR
ncbi:Major Facilitator Superfamily protein [Pseudosulfitobacter pseudonitzschiae]|uniref:Major facilitator superfamily (MFS) profile domain-containing protein n=1 Tax=Pseudosulfitobacter pseudonitzschiae TaxID=1402135 RepID=A0A073J414_9RHOB|nr:MFS transporter [Pseudosulfitobacter pseudonitzschiae]KEJ97363.1 hypothetical protein SUH3_11355 [Pseudosulfitobacter pseudonitzschiae]QKS10225.1 MFS transporter [Pseudosulfitobacter pseudonitzschiae]SHF58465.1 Major Facilitator Superfamily protein [Pseudosulfitobacter pseudonitzschiae]